MDFTYFLELSCLGFALGVNCSQEVDHGDKSGDDQVGSSLCSAKYNLVSVHFQNIFSALQCKFSAEECSLVLSR